MGPQLGLLPKPMEGGDLEWFYNSESNYSLLPRHCILDAKGRFVDGVHALEFEHT